MSAGPGTHPGTLVDGSRAFRDHQAAVVPLLVSLSCQWSTGHRGLTLAWAWPYRSGLGLAPVARGFAEQNGLICVHHHGHLSAHGPGASRWPALLLPGDPPEYPRGNNTRIAFASAQLLIPRLRCKPILGALQALGSQDTTWPPKPPAFLDVVARFWRSPPQQKPGRRPFIVSKTHLHQQMGKPPCHYCP